MTRVPAVLRKIDDLDAGWLAEALARPGLSISGSEPIGTGQMSESHRVRFSGPDGDGSIVIKLASRDENSRAAGFGLGAYRREVSFYEQLSTRLGRPLAGCHLAIQDASGFFTLLLEDIGAGTQGDQIAGCTPEQARIAMLALARLQAPVLGDLILAASDWLNLPNPLDQALLEGLLPGFLERYGERIAPEHKDVLRRFVASADAWAADVRQPLSLSHGDYRLDNLLFTTDDCVVVDWQTVSWGPAVRDVSYFLGGGLTVADRRAHERELVRAYYDELVRLGADELGWEHCWNEYRRQCFHGLVMNIAPAMVVERTERGDEMFMASTERMCQQVLDLDALSLLPDAGSARPAPLRPDPADEGLHEPGPEELWNESWYFDAVSKDGALGLYVRLGRLPNQEQALYVASVCRVGEPPLMLLRGGVPLPDPADSAQTASGEGLHATHTVLEPLERFEIVLAGTAESHDDPSAPLRAEAGEPVEIALDLVWRTDGIPYRWRQATRYEIPCLVEGTVTIGGEEHTFSGHGQRDHSWGSRDWWSVDWLWSALRLEDGTRIHAVAIPQMPGYGVGYVQRGDDLREITQATVTTEVRPDELIASSRLELGPDPLEIEIEPLAFGAVRLDAPDGRLSYFPRALCRVTTGDGRRGDGWVEWNRVQR